MTDEPNNQSGGANISAKQVTVGNDVVGRDKLVEAGTYIEHATIIQSGASVQDIKPNVSMLLGEIWLSDPNNHRALGELEFVRVPAGKFLMGSKTNNMLASQDERPQHTVEIPYDYWAGKYPVTNEQFAKFVASATYKFKQGDWQERADHPVVDVSWYDAAAYCEWLNETLRGELKDLTLRLPTEAEWEKAARGDAKRGIEWPWGNEFDQNKCNTVEGRERDTTPVGSYSPQGDSPYGAADMAGNVWEWCYSNRKAYPYKVDDERKSCMLRGGSFSDDRTHARAAYRNGFHGPAARHYNLGFRVVVAPSLPK